MSVKLEKDNHKYMTNENQESEGPLSIALEKNKPAR